MRKILLIAALAVSPLLAATFTKAEEQKAEEQVAGLPYCQNPSLAREYNVGSCLQAGPETRVYVTKDLWRASRVSEEVVRYLNAGYLPADDNAPLPEGAWYAISTFD